MTDYSKAYDVQAARAAITANTPPTPVGSGIRHATFKDLAIEWYYSGVPECNIYVRGPFSQKQLTEIIETTARNNPNINIIEKLLDLYVDSVVIPGICIYKKEHK